jgi:hypothetical protein
MVSLTGLALVGHMAFPLAPPRMMQGWVDTGALYGHSVYGPATGDGITNQFAAMPSLHVGWAFLISAFLIRSSRRRWRWAWAVHPLLTFAVVVVTANHYWLDGLVAIGLAVPILFVFDGRRSAVRSPTGASKARLRLGSVGSGAAGGRGGGRPSTSTPTSSEDAA